MNHLTRPECLFHMEFIIIIIIISIFKENNVFSIIASLPYGPPVLFINQALGKFDKFHVKCP